MLKKVNLRDRLAAFDAFWHPKIVGELNGQHVRLAKLMGEFVWHHHDAADELFLVLEGRLRILVRDPDTHEVRTTTLEPGEFVIVPRGVEHKPVADTETHILLFEPADTLNTGNVRNERTVSDLERL